VFVALRRLLASIVFGWAVVSALVALYLYVQLRERFGRGGPMPASQAGLLLTPARRWLHPAREMLERFGIRPGDTVLELGPGPGYFTVEAARLTAARGRVVCLDVQPEMIALLRGRLAEHGVSNARPLVGDAARLPLASAVIDCAFLVTVLGEIPDRPAALAELRRVIRPGGVLAIVETLGDPDYMLESSTRDLCRASGFEERTLTPQLLGYTMTFTQP
jgi:ubiquinone/menaquinone biosynthesis C-methylase UbiE